MEELRVEAGEGGYYAASGTLAVAEAEIDRWLEQHPEVELRAYYCARLEGGTVTITVWWSPRRV